MNEQSSKEDLFSFLDEFDLVRSTETQTKNTSDQNLSSSNPNPTKEQQDVLDFLDELTKRSSTPTTNLQTKSLNTHSPSISNKPTADPSSNASLPTSSQSHQPEPISLPGRSWAWGSVLKQATSNVLNQAINAAGQVQSVVIDPTKSSSELVKNLNQNLQSQLNDQTETARKWKEGMIGYVKSSGIDQLSKDLQATGLKSLNGLMNAVVPPISEHELIQVQLSYDMIGYDGIETLVYKSLSKIIEQVDGGELILNKGEEEKPKERNVNEPERDLQSVYGMIEGYKLALANLEQMIKRKTQNDLKEENPNIETVKTSDLPITKSSVYIRIQPIISTLPGLNSLKILKESNQIKVGDVNGISLIEEEHLFFLILLKDLNNLMDHATLSQSIPANWLQIPFEENEWVEEVMVEVICRATEVIGQQYVKGRLSGRSVKNSNQLVEEKSMENEMNDQIGLHASTSS